ncbi:hypothetical protein [Planococcus halocryophilus]|uniref:hypothetical protein n=1 Tax=Planococcus halocryophilus TaxID=1215089 RepID=UPI0012DE3940|nr:hypothetical protein [Planococcus halocryophilus]
MKVVGGPFPIGPTLGANKLYSPRNDKVIINIPPYNNICFFISPLLTYTIYSSIIIFYGQTLYRKTAFYEVLGLESYAVKLYSNLIENLFEAFAVLKIIRTKLQSLHSSALSHYNMKYCIAIKRAIYSRGRSFD